MEDNFVMNVKKGGSTRILAVYIAFYSLSAVNHDVYRKDFNLKCDSDESNFNE